MDKSLTHFRNIAVAEGWSYLILLFIAMPLKYLAHIQIVIKIVGWLHGILFITYCITLLLVMIKLKWSLLKSSIAFIASFIPFGTFVLDKKIKDGSF